MGTSAQSNWVLVPTKFDTSKFDLTKNGNMTLVFWVVVWMQDQSGKIVGEMPAHGLTGIPSAGIPDSNGQTTVHFPDVAGFEECQAQSQCYSNNVGFYKQKFFLAPISSSTTPGPLPMSGSLDIGKVDVSATRVTTSDNVVLSATLSAVGTAASGVSVNFYDGDPNTGGRLFAVERVPHIPANTQHMVQTTHRSRTCGVHHLFVVINRGRTTEIVRRAQPLRVFCNAGQ
jgi:hypothetical protein